MRTMKCTHTTTLSEQQKMDIRQLVEDCCLAEPVTLSAPLEDGLEYFLGYEDGKLVSMVFLFFPEDSVCECGAYTEPGHRRRGYFAELLEEALAFVEAYEERRQLDVDFCFLTDGNSPDAMAVIGALGAEYWYSEYSMSLELPGAETAALPTQKSGVSTPESDQAASALSYLSISEAEENLYTATLGGQPIGVCMIIPSGDTVYFYGFEIKSSFRRMGYGQQFLDAMIALLSNRYRRMTLQVSSQNVPALELYKKTGFPITETLSYYLY